MNKENYRDGKVKIDEYFCEVCQLQLEKRAASTFFLHFSSMKVCFIFFIFTFFSLSLSLTLAPALSLSLLVVLYLQGPLSVLPISYHARLCFKAMEWTQLTHTAHSCLSARGLMSSLCTLT